MITFAAPSGTGKTTLLEAVIAALVRRGYRIGALKHDAHRLKLDTPGKDSWRFRQAGAFRVLVASNEQMGIFSAVEGEVSLAGLVDRYLSDVDLVLTEGFRKAGLPTLRVHRAARPADPGWAVPRNVVAWVTDTPSGDGLPQLPLDDPQAVADFIEARWLRRASPLSAVTAVLPLGDDAGPGTRLAMARAVFGERVLAVTAPGVPAPAGVASVADIRPGLGPLGALLTGLAAVDTPAVLFWGPRHRHAPPALLRGLVAAAPQRADVVPLVFQGRQETLAAVYGHRCLSAIQAALLSGEPKMDGWWGQVRVHPVPEATWRPWDPGAAAFSGGGR